MIGRSFFLIAMGFVLTTPVRSEAQSVIPIGIRLDVHDATSDEPAEGPMVVTLRLYSSSAGGAALHTEAATATLQRGVATVALGEIVALDVRAFAADSIWLSLQVGTEPESTDRVRLLATAFAVRAQQADQASRADEAAHAQIAEEARSLPCAAPFVPIGDRCIDGVRRGSAPLFDAATACAAVGASLCTAQDLAMCDLIGPTASDCTAALRMRSDGTSLFWVGESLSGQDPSAGRLVFGPGSTSSAPPTPDIGYLGPSYAGATAPAPYWCCTSGRPSSELPE